MRAPETAVPRRCRSMRQGNRQTSGRSTWRSDRAAIAQAEVGRWTGWARFGQHHGTTPAKHRCSRLPGMTALLRTKS
jgi:hypothetical protein